MDKGSERPLPPAELAALEADLRDQRLAQLMETVAGMDHSSVDVTAGLKTVLLQIEAVAPGSLQAMLARIQMLRAERHSGIGNA
jgi:hypothetical protein